MGVVPIPSQGMVTMVNGVCFFTHPQSKGLGGFVLALFLELSH
jgi:hypothetical protein